MVFYEELRNHHKELGETNLPVSFSPINLYDEEN